MAAEPQRSSVGPIRAFGRRLKELGLILFEFALEPDEAETEPFSVQLADALKREEIVSSAERTNTPLRELRERAEKARAAIEDTALDEAARLAAGEAAVRRARQITGIAIAAVAALGVALGIIFTVNLVQGWALFGVAVGSAAVAALLGTVLLAATLPARWLIAREERNAAGGLYKTALLERGILPFLRLEINRLLEPNYTLDLDFESPRGLSELADETFEIPTEANNELQRKLDEIRNGSIGIAGPRGVGKSTLIRAFSSPSGRFRPKEALAFWVSAPVDYTARDFILHLYGKLCRSITGDDDRRPYFDNPRVRLGAAGVGVPLLIAAGVLLIVFDDSLPKLSVAQWCGVGLFVAAAFVLTVYLPPLILGELGVAQSELIGPGLAREARSRLKKIRFLQSISSGWAGELKLPIGRAGLTGGRTLIEQQATLPDLVFEFQRFATDVAQEAHGGLVIGIDELDKIARAEDAQKFMNDIKGVFGLPKCFFLISISEDALASFDRRGVPVRDAFDSSLDDRVRIDYLTLRGTRQLLQRRIIGLGVGFVCLCHVLAAGLPRDVIRVAREIVRDGPKGRLGGVTRRVLNEDFNRKREATKVAATAFAPLPEVGPLLAWLDGLTLERIVADTDAISPPTLPSLADRPGGDVERARLVAHLGAEFGAFAYLSLTIDTLFSGFDSDGLKEAAAPGVMTTEEASTTGVATEVAETVFDRLAKARQSLAVHPLLSWEQTADVRRESGLEGHPGRPMG